MLELVLCIAGLVHVAGIAALVNRLLGDNY